MRISLALCAILAALMTSCTESWGNEVLAERLRQIDFEDTSAVHVTVVNREGTDFPKTLLPKLGDHLRQLVAMEWIGNVGPWRDFCRLEIEEAVGDRLVVMLSTRDSLSGQPVAIVQESGSDNPRIGFFDGENLYRWLVNENLCSTG